MVAAVCWCLLLSRFVCFSAAHVVSMCWGCLTLLLMFVVCWCVSVSPALIAFVVAIVDVAVVRCCCLLLIVVRCYSYVVSGLLIGAVCWCC